VKIHYCAKRQQNLASNSKVRDDFLVIEIRIGLIEQGLTSHSTHFRSFRRQWGDCSISHDCSRSQIPQCVRCWVVCARPVVCVFYLKGIVSEIWSSPGRRSRSKCHQNLINSRIRHNIHVYSHQVTSISVLFSLCVDRQADRHTDRHTHTTKNNSRFTRHSWRSCNYHHWEASARSIVHNSHVHCRQPWTNDLPVPAIYLSNSASYSQLNVKS